MDEKCFLHKLSDYCMMTQQHLQTLGGFCVTRVIEHIQKATRRHGAHSNPALSHGIVFVRWRTASVRPSENNLSCL